MINLSDLEKKLDAGTYDQEALKVKGLLSTKKPVKLLGRGALKKKFSLSVHKASKSAKEAVENAGGSITLLA